jgi:hypothetical protein
VNKPINPWVFAGVIMLALGAAAFFYLRPRPTPTGRTSGGMPPGAAAEISRRMQDWQKQKAAAPAPRAAAPVKPR